MINLKNKGKERKYFQSQPTFKEEGNLGNFPTPAKFKGLFVFLKFLYEVV